MAPHPFTTIDPNIGFCLVPAPAGACPEEEAEESVLSKFPVGSSHGRDSQGRRLLPVLLKDVAGLVPGAYQGRGRGNKFLNDLTDADVLVHVVDSSGMADAEGNLLGEEEVLDASKASSRPLEDLAWIRNELIEWVYNNLVYKWDTVIRRGRSKVGASFLVFTLFLFVAPSRFASSLAVIILLFVVPSYLACSAVTARRLQSYLMS
jgi:ribosome-binding ATPase